ncbi:hypothetical protein M1O29_00210 [Dehalococcoidia bacterium]|nr:hypothetical protein [Dehalococcoidia bacterium]
MNASFPSAEWFKALQELMNGQKEKYERYGFVDSRAIFVVKPGDGLETEHYYATIFDTYECSDVKELSDGEVKTFDADWVYEGAYGDWKEMIENIKANGHADLDHSLNRLSLLKHPFRVHGIDQMRVDLFYRQQFTFQEFIDESSNVDTTFAV